MKGFPTERLRLRGWRAEDAPPLAAMNSDAEVMRYIGSGVRTYEVALSQARELIATEPRGPLGFWAIEERADGAFHGCAGMIYLDGSEEIEIAYRLARASWGRGIATEAARRLVDHGFADLGLDRIVAVTSEENLRSQKVLEKLGLRYVGRRRAYGVDGCWHYALNRTDWQRRGPNVVSSGSGA